MLIGRRWLSTSATLGRMGNWVRFFQPKPGRRHGRALRILVKKVASFCRCINGRANCWLGVEGATAGNGLGLGLCALRLVPWHRRLVFCVGRQPIATSRPEQMRWMVG